ncbi:Mor transcription activator family protein [Candidatus Dactylopiibacterium carminicum]|nr:Mor transcription activator family protein [Candidatus Dactylopiibacterium carminicum]
MPDQLTFPERYPPSLQLVAIAVHRYLVEHKILPHQEAAVAALGAAESVRTEIGGGPVYIGKGAYYEADVRAQEIYEKFNGRNGEQLEREYKLTPERIRQIVTERMRAERASRQAKLPGLD